MYYQIKMLQNLNKFIKSKFNFAGDSFINAYKLKDKDKDKTKQF